MGNSLKVIVILIALGGIAAIAYFLYSDEMQPSGVAQGEGETVRVERETSQETAGESSGGAGSATESVSGGNAGTDAAPAAEDLAAMSAADAAARFAGLEGDSRSAFAGDYVAAVGEQKAVEIAGEYRSAATPQDDAFAFEIARAALQQYDSSTAAYYVGYAYNTGRGAEKDLDAALRHLSHPGLDNSPGIHYQRARILADADYVNRDPAAAGELLQRVISDENARPELVERARELLTQIQG